MSLYKHYINNPHFCIIIIVHSAVIFIAVIVCIFTDILPCSIQLNIITCIYKYSLRFWWIHLGGIQYEGSCPCSVTTDFWVQFSTEFAQAARGTIFYLGYGERNGGTFQSTSFFATVEIPNLEYPRVTSAVVIVVHRKGEGKFIIKLLIYFQTSDMGSITIH